MRGFESLRWSRRWTQRAIAAAVAAATIGTVSVVGVNALLLGEVNGQVETAQSQSLNLSNALRETLLLQQQVTEFGETSDAADIRLQRGLLLRQLTVSTASYPEGAPEQRELLEVRTALEGFPWERMEALSGRGEPLRPLAIAMASQAEKRINALHVAQEKQFYTATTASLAAAQTGQVGSAVLVVVVLVLGWIGLASVTRRSRNERVVAFDRLQQEVMEKRAAEQMLIHQAHHDPLTTLPNRALLLERLRDALRAEPAAVSVLLIDLDGFKQVNDTLGHPVGDQLLEMAAQRLKGCLRDGDTASRLGGDEFAVLTSSQDATDPGPTGPADPAATAAVGSALAVGRRIGEVLSGPYPLAGREVRVTASIGVRRGAPGETAEDLLRDADIAMYAAKNTGKGRVEVFDPEMRAQVSQRTTMQQDLARAVEHDEIEVHFQPIIDLHTLRPTTLEALARWRRGGDLVTADAFIPAAEDSGAIVDIGRAVLRTACHAARRWRRLPGHADLAIAVNVSMQQVLSGRLPEHVVEALRDSGLPPSALVLEITESAAADDPERVAAVLARLRATGVRLAVDDFGAGYSSLAYLMRLPADILKIDRTLLDFVTTRDGSLVNAVAELGRTLGLLVVVEGVETPDHLARAREAACDAAQGFHFSRPLPAIDVPAYLGGWPAPRPVDRGAGAVRG
ncbi:MAG TPA: EAL domain-containing protein [Pseudonocardia sp.]|nr:EAL domain-containing protein [Pseudonocardia sp.]